MWIYCYVIIFTFLLSIGFTLMFEVPFMTLEKLVIFRKKERKDSVADLQKWSTEETTNGKKGKYHNLQDSTPQSSLLT